MFASSSSGNRVHGFKRLWKVRIAKLSAFKQHSLVPQAGIAFKRLWKVKIAKLRTFKQHVVGKVTKGQTYLQTYRRYDTISLYL